MVFGMFLLVLLAKTDKKMDVLIAKTTGLMTVLEGKV